MGEIKARNHDLEDAGTFPVDGLVSARHRPATSTRCSCPGGTVNPDKLRMDRAAVGVRPRLRGPRQAGSGDLSRPMDARGGRRRAGRTLTSCPSLRTDLRNAGAHVVDREVVQDGNITTSRSPDDLPAFSAAIVDAFAGSRSAAGSS